jgi:Zn-dependent protease
LPNFSAVQVSSAAQAVYNGRVSAQHPPPHVPFPARDAEPAVEVTEFLEQQRQQVRATAAEQRRRFFRRRLRLSVALFVATCISTFLVGLEVGDIRGIFGRQYVILTRVAAYLVETGQIPEGLWSYLGNGLLFSGCLMGILVAHEMGHYLQAVRHRVPATLPFFIPFPFTPFGTMGAVIVQDAGRANRRQLFDIAVSGPIAGLVVALPVLWYGVATSFVIESPPDGFGIRYGDPLLVQWIVAAVHGGYGPGQDIAINAPLFAGWVGIFITALNLMPIGQLDGGHILYTLIGRRSHYVAYAVLTAAVLWMLYTQRMHYALIVLLLFIFGFRHPPTADDRVPLGPWRTALGWLTLSCVIIGFTPTPVMM